ncbi:GNAT family N-acetyltransferase [Roseovarius sp.]|uniref:GNAT family N-acetyltransferase n=1 Tax=Roseovarius sp. TaxID=1486281 RepID=UPI0025D70483|nr:N-acetyltransferase [Roseovarius sp.]
MKRTQFSREMRRGEEPAVAALLQRAFGGQDEVRLVEKLRRAGDIAGETVLPSDDGIVGYYALSVMRSPKRWLCLAPVAIDPDWQGQGHGRRMIGLLSEWARMSGCYVVVLGQPGFYARAGFSLERAARLSSPYPITNTLLAGPGADVPEQSLIYPKAFEGP